MAHPAGPPAVPPAAAGGGGPPPAPVPPVAPTNYRELYSDATNSPPFDRTAGYLASYRFAEGGLGGVPTPAALRDQTVAISDRQPMTFLALVVGQDGVPEIAILHRALRYMDTPGDDPSGYHDRVLGLLGDILPHQYPVIEIPGSAFHLVNTAVRVPTVAAMDALLPTWADQAIPLGPYTEADPETEVVRPRHTQLIPARYASLLVHRRRIRAKQAYQEIVGAVRADDAVAACNDVLIWLRAACTARGGGGAQTLLPSVLHVFTPLHLPMAGGASIHGNQGQKRPTSIWRSRSGPAWDSSRVARRFTGPRRVTRDSGCQGRSGAQDHRGNVQGNLSYSAAIL